MLQCVRVTSPSDPRFPALWNLYAESFPLEERRPFLCQVEAMEKEEAFHCLHLEDEKGFAGLLFYWILPQGIYVEHLAVEKSRRGQGVGRRVLERIARMGLPVILEIEPVQDAATRRRLHFYESAGYVRLPYEHAQLPFRKGGDPVPMELLSFPSAMPEDEVRAFQAVLREHVMRYREG